MNDRLHLYSIYQRIKNNCCELWRTDSNIFYEWYENQEKKQKGLCHYCEIDFNDILELQDRVVQEGLVPYEMTMFQRRSWSGTPAKVFRV